MSKWCDYGISEIRIENRKIKSVKAHKDLNFSFSLAEEQPRKWLLSNQNMSFFTISQGDNGKIEKGAKIYFVEIDGDKFLRTDHNKIPEDNLGNLPEF